MKPKKILALLFFAMVTSMVTPVFATNPVPVANTEKSAAEAMQVQAMNRITEIRDMDRSSLSAKEKKELRKELRMLKKEAAPKKNGIYLSLGAIIIIGVLLILLL